MRINARIAILAASVLWGLPCHAAEKPNIIFILADDLGYNEIGAFGQKVIQTPNLDRMAAEGMSFTNFYAGATVCGPSRSVLMTGLHQGHTRIRGNFPQPESPVGAFRDEDLTVSEALKKTGYTNAMIGKWGLGNTGGASAGLPRNQGFDFFTGFLSHWHAHNHYPDYLWRNEEKISLPNKVITVGDLGGGYSEDGVIYADDFLTDEALKFVARHQDKPFFLYWSFILPHANNERNTVLKNGTDVPDFGPYAGEVWPDQDKGHAAMVTRMDSYVGRMLDLLKSLGIDDNTLVVFTSDNGPHNESSHNLTRFQPAAPLRGIKRDLTDGGIRVPAIFRWPGKIKPDTKSDHVSYFGDWFATACALAGAPIPPDLDSISLTPTLLGDTANQRNHEFIFWEFHEKGYDQAALYQGRWKGIRLGSVNKPIALYDLENDINEAHDVAAKHPVIVAKINAYLKTARSEAADWPVK